MAADRKTRLFGYSSFLSVYSLTFSSEEPALHLAATLQEKIELDKPKVDFVADNQKF